MTALLSSVLVASFLGSLHCAGMCGGFVLFFAGNQNNPLRKSWAPHLGYHLARLFVYSLLGALAGGLGSTIDWAGSELGIGRAAAIVAGAWMILWGVLVFAGTRGVRIPKLKLPERIDQIRSAAVSKLASHPPAIKAILIGLISVLLPCGWLYAYVVVASGTGQPVHGALVMATFWLGGLPVLSGLGLGAQRLSLSFRKRLPALGALIIVIIGLITLAGRMNLPQPLPPAENQAEAAQPPVATPCHLHPTNE